STTGVLGESFFSQAEDGIRDFHVTGVQTCALPIYYWWFPLAISQWIGTSYLLLIWLLLFNFIQAERYCADPSKTTVWVKLAAVRSEERRVGNESGSRWAADM